MTHPDIASIGDTGESSDISSDISSPGILSPDTPGPSIPSPAHTRTYGKAKKTKKDRETHWFMYWTNTMNKLITGTQQQTTCYNHLRLLLHHISRKEKNKQQQARNPLSWGVVKSEGPPALQPTTESLVHNLIVLDRLQ